MGSEASMEVRWYTRVGATGSEKGPFETAALIAAIRQGHVSEKTLVRRDGKDDWLPIRDEPALTQRPLPPSPEALEEAQRISDLVDTVTGRFSWGVLLFHVVVSAVLFIGVVFALTFSSSSSSPRQAEAIAYQGGRLLVSLVLPVAALGSYFYQKRRR